MAIKRLPWLRMQKKTDREVPVRLPIAAGSITNGEGWWPDTKRKKLLRKLVLEKAEEGARLHGVDRREFLASSCGMATTLFMINVINGCSGGGKDGSNPSVVQGPNGQPMPGGTGGAGQMPVGGTGGSGMNMTGDPVGGMGGTGGSGMVPGPGPTTNPNDPFQIPEGACLDETIADSILMGGGNELVIDMQSHFATPETNPIGAALLDGFVGQISNTRFPWIVRSPGVTSSGKYNRDEYVAQIMDGSPTTIGVLSGIAYTVGADGTMGSAVLTNEDLLTGADWLAEKYPGRILKHCMVMPNDRIDIQLAMMERNASSYHNWKTYPPFQSGGTGYWLDQGVGPQMIQKGIDLKMPIFCIHKGFPLNGFSAEHCHPKDVGPAAKMFPDAILVVYHSGFENGLNAGQSSEPVGAVWGGLECGEGDLVGGQWPEGPYPPDGVMSDVGITWPTEAPAGMVNAQVNSYGDPALGAMTFPHDRGVNSLIKSLRDAGIGPNGTDLGTDRNGPQKWNVYAECGGVWPALMTGRHEEAIHYWGKLLLHVGEDRLTWGTDCLWFGSPTPLIQAFRCFQIPEAYREAYGYPEITQEIREKILGQNAARIQSVHPDVNLMDTCHDDLVTEAQRTRKRELDEEFGVRRDMIADVWGPKNRREFMGLVKEEMHEKQQWSGKFPEQLPTSKDKVGKVG